MENPGYLSFWTTLAGAFLLHAVGIFDLTTLVKEYPLLDHLGEGSLRWLESGCRGGVNTCYFFPILLSALSMYLPTANWILLDFEPSGAAKYHQVGAEEWSIGLFRRVFWGTLRWKTLRVRHGGDDRHGSAPFRHTLRDLKHTTRSHSPTEIDPYTT